MPLARFYSPVPLSTVVVGFGPHGLGRWLRAKYVECWSYNGAAGWLPAAMIQVIEGCDQIEVHHGIKFVRTVGGTTRATTTTTTKANARARAPFLRERVGLDGHIIPHKVLARLLYHDYWGGFVLVFVLFS